MKPVIAPVTRTRNLLIPFLLVMAAAAVYGITGSFEFLHTWDDGLYVLRNETIRGFGRNNIIEAFSSIYIGNYAPLHILSYMMDFSLWGLDPSGYHLMNVLLHATNAILVWVLLRSLQMPPWSSAASALIFLLHPVQVETVAWVSERKNILAMFFFLLAWIAFHGYHKSSSHHRKLYVLSFLLFLAGLLSKAILVMFPLILLLYLKIHGEQPFSYAKAAKQVLPFFLTAAAFAVITIHFQAGEFGGGRGNLHGGSPLSTFFTIVPVLAGYIRDCFIPLNLSPFYMVPVRQHPDGDVCTSLAVLVAVAAAGIMVTRRDKTMMLWLGVFFLFLLPVMQVVPLITLKNDRYLYFPMIGFATFVVRAASAATSNSWLQRAAAVFLGVAIIGLSLMSYRQTQHWRDDVTLWEHAVQVDQENRLAWRLLALSYTRRGDTSSAFSAIATLNTLRRKYGFIPGYDDLVKKQLEPPCGTPGSGEGGRAQ